MFEQMFLMTELSKAKKLSPGPLQAAGSAGKLVNNLKPKPGPLQAAGSAGQLSSTHCSFCHLCSNNQEHQPAPSRQVTRGHTLFDTYSRQNFDINKVWKMNRCD